MVMSAAASVSKVSYCNLWLGMGTMTNKHLYAFFSRLPALFDSLDCSHDGTLGFDELFRFYKSVLSPTFDDDYIIDLVVRILQRSELQEQHRVSYQDFQKVHLTMIVTSYIFMSYWYIKYASNLHNHFSWFLVPVLYIYLMVCFTLSVQT